MTVRYGLGGVALSQKPEEIALSIGQAVKVMSYGDEARPFRTF